MALKNRTDLKSYFVKNAIPTEGNFADLIDSQLNQTQDGVFKPDGDAAERSSPRRRIRSACCACTRHIPPRTPTG